jgi:hypothetical protein
MDMTGTWSKIFWKMKPFISWLISMRILWSKFFWNLYPLQKPLNIHAYSVIIHVTKPRLRKSRFCMGMYGYVWICMDTFMSAQMPESPRPTWRRHSRRPGPPTRTPSPTPPESDDPSPCSIAALWLPVQSLSPGCSCGPPQAQARFCPQLS